MRISFIPFFFALLSYLPVSAQSTATGISTSKGISIKGSGSTTVCQIVTDSVPTGTVGVTYVPFQLTSANCTGSLTWSISAGALPIGLSLSASGLITGVPTVAGTASFTAKVVGTPSSITDIFDTGLTIDTASVGGDPAPPDPALMSWCTSVACTPSPNTLVTVGDGSGSPCDQTGGVCSWTTSQLNLALATIGCGQTLELQNTVYVISGSIKMIANCDLSNWITVTRDFSDTTFPLEGIRVTPCYAGLPSTALPGYPSYTCSSPARHMPLILKSTGSAVLQFGSSVATDLGASAIRFVGIQWGRQTTYDLDFGILSLLNNNGCTAANIACMNHQPNHIIFDRNIIQGDAQRQTTRALNFGGQWIDIKDSYVYDIFLSFAGGGGDAQAFAGGSGKNITNVGFWKSENVFAAASTMGCLFCGAFVEPISPTTTFDGIPHDVWQTKQWFWKNPYWNPQIGRTFNETINIEGVNYGPTPDQEFVATPSSVSLQQGKTYDVHNATLYDSGGGLDRMTDAASGGSVTIDGLACTFTSTNGVGAIPSGSTSIVVASVANLLVNHSILITGALSGGSNYIGTITNITGTTVTISPATTGAVANGVSIFDPVCIPGGDSTHGHLEKNSSHGVGSGAYLMQNIISWTYIACSGAGVPFVDCSGATTAATHNLIFTKNLVDNRSATYGNTRPVTSTVSITVTSGAPAASINIAPSASDLELQPSYPGAGTTDAFGNSRQFCQILFEIPNYVQAGLTWKVDTITGGNFSVGTIQFGLSGLVTGEAIYCAGNTTGTHTISVTDGSATGSRDINVTTSAPIVAMDDKPFVVKNGWEMKCISRGKFDFSTIENVWATQANGGFQVGECMLNQPINQASQTTDGNGVTVNYGPEFISDLDVNHIHCIHVGQGLITAGLSDAKGLHRVKYSNIFIEDLNAKRWRNATQKFQFAAVLQFIGAGGTKPPSWTSAASPLTDHIKFDHFTAVGGSAAVPGIANWMSVGNNNGQFQLGPFSFTNSIVVAPGTTTFNNNNGDTGDCDVATGSGSSNTEARAFQGVGNTLSRPCFSTYDISRNAIVDNTAAVGTFSTTTIWQPLDSDATLFGNYNLGNGGNYAVPAGSQYAAGGARDASDGLALGADIAGILSNDAVVRWGAASPPSVDMLTVALMSTPNRLSKHMHGTVNGGSDTYSLPDTDAGYPAGYPTGTFFWAKHPTGNPWDIEKYDSTYAALHWITEDGDSTDQTTCIAAGFSGGCFLDPRAYKRFLNPVPMFPRTFTYGSVVTIDTPGPNTFVRTTNCEAPGTSTNINLGDIRSITSGPYLMTWGGTIDSGTGVVGSNGPTFDNVNGVETFRNDYYYGGTLASGIFNDKESTFYVVGSGRVAWFFYQLSGGAYTLQQWTINNTLTNGGTTANFPCGSGQTWWH